MGTRLHALCSPSGAKRWLTCPGSVALGIDEPERESEAAAQGTYEHDLGEQLCRITFTEHGIKPDDSRKALAIREFFKTIPHDQSEARDRVITYVENCVAQVEAYARNGYSVTIYVERSFDLSEITGEENAVGTSDFTIIADKLGHPSIIHVIDYKGGHQPVYPEDPQLKLYALAVWRTFSLTSHFEVVNCTIIQPKVSDEMLNATFNIQDELVPFWEEIKGPAKLALHLVHTKEDPTPHLHKDPDACRFCVAKYKCPELVQTVYGTVYGPYAAARPTNLQPPTTDEWTPEMLGRALQNVPYLQQWTTAIIEKVDELLKNGTPVPGFKLVEGNEGRRSWRSEIPIEAFLMDHQYPRECFTELSAKTPAQMEKVLKKAYPQMWKALEQFITRPQAPDIVVPESDIRSDIHENLMDEAEDLTLL